MTTTPTPTPQEDEEYKRYIADRTPLWTTEYEVGKTLDQNVLTLSGSLLTLSITFYEKLVAKPVQIIGFLAVAWTLLLVSVVATLWSHHTSILAFRAAREARDTAYREGKPPPHGMNINARRTELLNTTAIVTFALGVASLVVFTVQNLRYR